MLRPLHFMCLLCISCSVHASAQPRRSHAPRKAETLRQLRLNAPRLVWQAILVGRETVRLVGVGPGRIAVLAEPRHRIENGVYIPHSIQLVAYDVKSGAVQWRKEILGSDIATAADDSSLIMKIQLPLVSYDPFDFHADDISHEIITFRWSDGRIGWRIPCVGTTTILAGNRQLYYDERHNNPYSNNRVLIAVDADTGKRKWRTAGGDINGLFQARGELYAYDDARDSEGEFLTVIDPATGVNTRKLLLYPLFRPTTHLSTLAWIPQTQVLIGAIEQNTTPGINNYQIRALDAEGKPIWERPDAGRFQLVHNSLICQHYGLQPGEYPHGIVALDPATGHEIWRRTDLKNANGKLDINFGAWRGQAVVLQHNQLCGLDPRTGKTVWVLDVLPPEATPDIQQVKIVGDIIIVAVCGSANRPAQVRAYGIK